MTPQNVKDKIQSVLNMKNKQETVHSALITTINEQIAPIERIVVLQVETFVFLIEFNDITQYITKTKFVLKDDVEYIVYLLVLDTSDLSEKDVWHLRKINAEFTQYFKIQAIAEWDQQAEFTSSLYALKNKFPRLISPIESIVKAENIMLFGPIVAEKLITKEQFFQDIAVLKQCIYVIGRFHGLKKEEKTDFVRYKQHLIKVAPLVSSKTLNDWRTKLKNDSYAGTILDCFTLGNFYFSPKIIYVFGCELETGSKLENLGSFFGSIILEIVKQRRLQKPFESTKDVIKDVSSRIIVNLGPELLDIYLQTIKSATSLENLELLDFFIGHYLIMQLENISNISTDVANIISAMSTIFVQEAPLASFYDQSKKHQTR